MTPIAIDTEVTTFNKGDPFDHRNKFVLGGMFNGIHSGYFNSTISEFPILHERNKRKRYLLFNAKFDLHWLRNIGFTLEHGDQIWDCQLAEYILSNQQWKYPSLEEACAKRGLGRKIDVIKTEYWDKGIDTDAIPIDILTAYLQQDLYLTYKLYLKQVEDFKSKEHQGKYALFRLHCQDLLALAEMEYNGFKYNVDKSLAEAERLSTEIAAFDDILSSFAPDIPINFNSNNHLSSLLYGGTIEIDERIPIGVYKTGIKAGQVRNKVVTKVYELERLIEPSKGSELAREGYFSTDEDTLRNLKASGRAKTIIEALLERRGLEKLRGTYYTGIPLLISNHCWSDSIVHGQLNQCVTVTGRLSATKPNQQNMTKAVKKFCESRYG